MVRIDKTKKYVTSLQYDQKVTYFLLLFFVFAMLDTLALNGQIVRDAEEETPPVLYSLKKVKPYPGYYFLEKNYPGSSYIIIIDNDGLPVFYRKMNTDVHNFTLQPSGHLSYYVTESKSFHILDSAYQVIDSFEMKNGYEADSHEFILKKSGHSFLMAYDHKVIDMDTVVEGGKKGATVIGLVIQELDENKDVVFQWRSWDHLPITDVDENIVRLTQPYIDLVHGNAISIDSDTSMILCLRNYNEVNKIDRRSGEVIWRMGGKKNEFTFINDNKRFQRQHSAVKLKNGNLILFDNGLISDTLYSRGVEYKLNEIEKTATLVKEFIHDSLILSSAMGHIQRLPNGGTVIGWGKNFGKFVFSEYLPDGRLSTDFYSDDNVKSYRVNKFNWNTNFITFDRDSLIFADAAPFYESVLNIFITNNTALPVTLTGYRNNGLPFYPVSTLPFAIQPKSGRQFQIKFSPARTGAFNGDFTLISEENTEKTFQLLSKHIYLSGISSNDTPQLIKSNDVSGFYQVYPNPAKDYFMINNIMDMDFLTIYGIMGKKIKVLEIRDRTNMMIPCSDLPKGFYIITFRNRNGESFSGKLFISGGNN